MHQNQNQMQQLREAVYRNKLYFAALITTLLIATWFMIVNSKEAAFISLNIYHPFYLNVFFINYTFIGDGIFACCLVAAMFFYFKKKETGLALLCSFLISGLAVQLIKNFVSAARPRLYFEAGTYLHFIDGVSLGNYSGFPSGHTATAFAIATVLVLMISNKKLQWPVFLAALLAGYSRIYLAQHFLLDVIVGMLLGTVSGIISFYLVQNRISLRRSFKKIHPMPSGSVSSPGAIQTV